MNSWTGVPDKCPRKRTTLARGGGGEGRRVQPRGVGLNTSERIGLHRYYTCGAHRLQVQHSPFHVPDSTRDTATTRPTSIVETVTTSARIDDAESRRPVGRIAAFFDLDKTIIAKSSTLAFSKPFFDQGLINRRAVLKSSYAQFLFLLSGADHDQMERMRAHIANMCAGWDVEQVRSIVAETLHDIVDPLVFAEAADLIADHKLRGHDVVVVSASGEEIVGPIAEALGADISTATRMEVENGRYNGTVEFYCYGEGKVEAMNSLAESRNYDLSQCFAYSDSITDLPMLNAVGHPTAVNPDRALRKEAASAGWPILTFSNPVSLRSRIQTPSGTTVAASAAVGFSAVIAGAVTYGLLRKKR